MELGLDGWERAGGGVHKLHRGSPLGNGLEKVLVRRASGTETVSESVEPGLALCGEAVRVPGVGEDVGELESPFPEDV